MVLLLFVDGWCCLVVGVVATVVCWLFLLCVMWCLVFAGCCLVFVVVWRFLDVADWWHWLVLLCALVVVSCLVCAVCWKCCCCWCCVLFCGVVCCLLVFDE